MAIDGLTLANVRQPKDGLVLGGQPSPADLKKVAEAGFDAVVDLRGPGEPRGYDEKGTAEKLGLAYHAIPIEGATSLSLSAAEKLGAILEESQGTVVHCASGNRVGGLFALLAAFEGASEDEAIAVGREHGMMPNLDRVVGMCMARRG